MDHGTDLPDGLERRLSAHLRDTTGTTGSPTLDEVRRRGRRRRSARRATGAVGAVALLAGAGVLVATVVGGDRGDELVVGAPDSTAATTTEPLTSEPTTTTPAIAPTPAGAGDADGATSTAAVIDGSSGGQLVPWGEGFLAIENYTAPQVIGELTPEILDLFPQDVRDLFPTLPTTIDEAIQVLQRHPEQMTAVQQVLEAHPEVSDAIYGSPSPTIVRAKYSDDGLSWETVGELALPDGVNWVQAAEAHDGRLVVAGTGSMLPHPDGSELLDGFPEERAFVAVTTDLETWDAVHELEVPGGLPVLPPGFWGSTWVQSVDVGPAGVIVAVQEQTNFEVSELLPADVRARLDGAGYGVSYDRTGVTVEIGGGMSEVPPAAAVGDSPATTVAAEPSTPDETLYFTWDELGVDGKLVTDPTGSTVVWTGDPAGELSHHVVEGVDGSQTYAVAPQWGGFAITFGGSELRVMTSPDGRAWTQQLLGSGTPAWPSALVEASDQLILLANDGVSTVVWRSTADLATWTSSTLPVPDGEVAAWVNSAAGGPYGAAMIAMVSPAGRGMPQGEVVVERDGFRLTVTVGPMVWRFVVTGPGVDGPETVHLDIDGSELDTSDRVELAADDELRVRDPETGAIVVSFSEPELAAAFAEAFPDTDLEGSDGGGATFGLWYSADGVVWTELDRLGPADTGLEWAGESYPVDVAVSATRVVALFERYGSDGSMGREFRVYDI